MNLDVTALFEFYREHARHLRNSAFNTYENDDWDFVSDFKEVDHVLFDCLVLRRLWEGYFPAADAWRDNAFFLLEPKGGGFNVMIPREYGSGYYDHPIKILFKDDAEIAFEGYFDFNQLGLIDFRYYKGTIIASTKHPDLKGYSILIETNGANVAINPARISPELDAEQGGRPKRKRKR